MLIYLITDNVNSDNLFDDEFQEDNFGILGIQIFIESGWLKIRKRCKVARPQHVSFQKINPPPL